MKFSTYLLSGLLIFAAISGCKKDSTTSNNNNNTTGLKACFTVNTATTPIGIGDYVDIDASCSVKAKTYTYNFGNGTSYTDTNDGAYITYAAPGTYTITLTVTDSVGNTNTTSKTVTIINQFTKYAGTWNIVETSNSGGGSIHYTSQITVANNGTLTITNFGYYSATVNLTYQSGLEFGGTQVVSLADNVSMQNNLEFNAIATPLQFTCNALYQSPTDIEFSIISAIKQ
ncbi:MAG: hypothetical protein JWN78_952 [Bacteroidota bacterium]|nr:hypothetical protein [Bacteroidota bacterium]